MLVKIFRFLKIYGVSRTLIKIAGRERRVIFRWWFKSFKGSKKEVSLIGTGQFGFSTISYFINKNQGKVFLHCFDIDDATSKYCSKFWGYKNIDVDSLLTSNVCKYVYIASNHASHANYAVKALKQGKVVYVEKPIATDKEQFNLLLRTLKEENGELYVGYNRPFSSAILSISDYIRGNKEKLSLSCFISAHVLDQDHWYRKKEEGTRVAGNVGHWLDLMVALMNTRGLIPQKFTVNITYSDTEEFDDNISIGISTEIGDVIQIMITSRSEPLEGINESIDLQCGKLIAKIDDFRKATIWYGNKKKSYNYFPKDVGHKKAINQPFDKKKRDFEEVKVSTFIMLEIVEMVRAKETNKQVLVTDF